MYVKGASTCTAWVQACGPQRGPGWRPAAATIRWDMGAGDEVRVLLNDKHVCRPSAGLRQAPAKAPGRPQGGPRLTEVVKVADYGQGFWER